MMESSSQRTSVDYRKTPSRRTIGALDKVLGIRIIQVAKIDGT
jgi:hypothetical protein